MHAGVDDVAAWQEFVSSDAQLTRTQVRQFADVLASNFEMCEWAVSLLGLSGGELVDKYGCRGSSDDREEALAFVANAGECQRRLLALSNLVRAAGLRVRLASCQRDGFAAVLAASCGSAVN